MPYHGTLSTSLELADIESRHGPAPSCFWRVSTSHLVREPPECATKNTAACDLQIRQMFGFNAKFLLSQKLCSTGFCSIQTTSRGQRQWAQTRGMSSFGGGHAMDEVKFAPSQVERCENAAPLRVSVDVTRTVAGRLLGGGFSRLVGGRR